MFILKNAAKSLWQLSVKKTPKISSKIIYYRIFRKRLNLKNPTTFNEKLMWLKLYEDDSLKVKCADKYLVRDYISKLGYSNILVDLCKVYENTEEINFEELPKRFVMKCTHGSGFNIICHNKDEIDTEKTRALLKNWMETDYGLKFCEPHYSPIKPRINVERFLENELNGQVPIDYMIHCFNGEPSVIEVGLNRYNFDKRDIMFTCDWKILPYNEASMNCLETIAKPSMLDEMLQIARDLSGEFTYVRVDLYSCNNKVYFGELTFTPAGCLDRDFINDAEYKMGDLLDLTDLKKGSLSNESLQRNLKMKMVNIASKIWPMVIFIA